MDIPSNSEIFLVLSNVLSKIEDMDGIIVDHTGGVSRLNDQWFEHAMDLRDRMMASDLGRPIPPPWVTMKKCSKCGGTYFSAVLSREESFDIAPHAIEFKSTLAQLYHDTMNVEFDNYRVRVGSGQTMRRWIKHEELCGIALEDTIELYKPIWLATYKPVNKETSIMNLKEILD
jgi:hypothetical protein